MYQRPSEIKFSFFQIKTQMDLKRTSSITFTVMFRQIALSLPPLPPYLPSLPFPTPAPLRPSYPSSPRGKTKETFVRVGQTPFYNFPSS